jgi:hypothetical protein
MPRKSSRVATHARDTDFRKKNEEEMTKNVSIKK